MGVVLHHQPLAVGRQGGFEVRHAIQGGGDGLEQKGQEGELDALGRRGRLLRLAEVLQLGDVRLVELGHVRHREPGPMQVPAAQFLDPGEFPDLHGAELGEVHLGGGRQGEGQGAGGGHRRPLGQGLLDVALDVLLEDPALEPRALDEGQIDTQLPGEAAHPRAGVGLAALGEGRQFLGAGQHRSQATLDLAGGSCRGYGTRGQGQVVRGFLAASPSPLAGEGWGEGERGYPGRVLGRDL